MKGREGQKNCYWMRVDLPLLWRSGVDKTCRCFLNVQGENWAYFPQERQHLCRSFRNWERQEYLSTLQSAWHYLVIWPGKVMSCFVLSRKHETQQIALRFCGEVDFPPVESNGTNWNNCSQCSSSHTMGQLNAEERASPTPPMQCAVKILIQQFQLL